jgi:tetratricopeptide (TPR) repeat protein
VATENRDWQPLLFKLRQAGQTPDRALLDAVKTFGLEVAPALIAMATDDLLHTADSESPDVWAPLHAIQLLGELEAAEAVEPLLPFFNRNDDDALSESLEEAFGRIGRPALAGLRGLVVDRSRELFTRVHAVEALTKVAEHHPELRSEVIAILVGYLDPAESRTPDDETVAAWAVCSLLDVRAIETLPAIRRAYAEDRLDRRIVDLDDVLREFGLPAERTSPKPADDDALHLWLRCTNCRYEREHDVETVYYDAGTAERRRAGEPVPYSEYIVPQRIICPKCGAVDQYELAPEAHLTLAGELLKNTLPRSSAKTRNRRPAKPSRVEALRFTIDGNREAHPYEARDIYRQRVALQPDDAALRVHYGNVLRVIRDDDEARHQFNVALALDPTNAEAIYNLGLLADLAGDRAAFRALMERTLAVAPHSRLPRQKLLDCMASARAALDELDGIDPARRQTSPSLATLFAHPARAAQLAAPLRPVAPADPFGGSKVGRNEPCPCGSGKKYKKCHGR